MTNILRNLRITRVASVDKGAGEGVDILITKKDGKLATLLKESVAVLKASVKSIVGGDDPLLDKTFQEFEQHVQSSVTASGNDNPVRSADTGDLTDGVEKKDNEAMPMTDKETADLKKRAEDAEKAQGEVQKALEEMKDQVAFLSMAPKYQEFAKAMSPADKKKFTAKADPAKDEEMQECAKKAQEQVPESVKKALKEAEDIKTANVELQKRLTALEDSKATEDLRKRAEDIGLGAAEAELLRKARKGDVEAVKKLEDRISALTKQVKEAGLFKEFGATGTGTTGGSAYDQLKAKADECRKVDPKLTPEKAFEKAYTDPSNRDLVAIYKRETHSVAA